MMAPGLAQQDLAAVDVVGDRRLGGQRAGLVDRASMYWPCPETVR